MIFLAFSLLDFSSFKVKDPETLLPFSGLGNKSEKKVIEAYGANSSNHSG